MCAAAAFVGAAAPLGAAAALLVGAAAFVCMFVGRVCVSASRCAV